MRAVGDDQSTPYDRRKARKMGAQVSATREENFAAVGREGNEQAWREETGRSLVVLLLAERAR